MTSEDETAHEPEGFSTHTRGSSSENARDQGWGLNQNERARDAGGPQNATGGSGYDYGAHDFSDTPSDTREARAIGSSTEERQEMLEEGESGDDAQEQMESEAESVKEKSASAQPRQRISASRG